MRLGVLALADGSQHELRRQRHRHILHRVHGYIGAPARQRVLELLHEQAFAADLGEGGVQAAVALGGQSENFRGQARAQLREPRLDVTRLPHGQRAFARRDYDTFGLTTRHWLPVTKSHPKHRGNHR